jgi:hypothetical protein
MLQDYISLFLKTADYYLSYMGGGGFFTCLKTFKKVAEI